MGEHLDLSRVDNAFSNEKKLWVADTNLVSDGYHTFGELYKHRCVLFIALCQMIKSFRSERLAQAFDPEYYIYASKRHFGDTQDIDGYFILGILYKGKQVTYHLPIDMWSDYQVYMFADVLENALEFDGHTSDDVLERLKELR